MRAGRLTYRVTFRRREENDDGYGNTYGQLVDYLVDWPADFVRQSGAEAVQGGAPIDLRKGILTVRDSAETRTITAADQVVIEGIPHGIESVSIPDRRTRTIDMLVSTGGGA